MTAALDGRPFIGGERIDDSSGGAHQHIYPATGRTEQSDSLEPPRSITRSVLLDRFLRYFADYADNSVPQQYP